MIKILHIISDLRRGGRERQLAVLASYTDNNLSHRIITLNDSVESYVNEYELNKISNLGKRKLQRFKTIYRIVKDDKIDIIHTWGNNETIYAFPASKLLKVPLLNGSVRHGIRLNKFSQLFRSWILRRSKFVLANSNAGLRANKIIINKSFHFILYNGIGDKFFVQRNIKKRKNLLKSFNLQEDAIIFLSIMNFIPYKDYITPLKALAELKNEGYQFIYYMVGKGKRENEIKNLILELGLEKSTSIISNNSITDLTEISDILIHSSLGEGCSNAILEAKAGGLLIVASDTGGTKEIIDENDFLFEYKNKTKLKDKLKESITSLRNKKNISELIQQRTKQRFSIEIYKEEYIKIINKIIHNYSND